MQENILEMHPGFVFSFINEWKQVFGGYNWTNYNFCLVQLMYENDIILGGYELQIIVLGIGFRIRYNKPIKTKEMIEIEERIQKIEDGTIVTKPWSEIREELYKGKCPRCCYKLDETEKDND